MLFYPLGLVRVLVTLRSRAGKFFFSGITRDDDKAVSWCGHFFLLPFFSHSISAAIGARTSTKRENPIILFSQSEEESELGSSLTVQVRAFEGGGRRRKDR